MTVSLALTDVHCVLYWTVIPRSDLFVWPCGYSLMQFVLVMELTFNAVMDPQA